MVDRQSPSGPLTSLKGTIAIASTAVALTAAATATGSFTGAIVGDVVSLSPQANLNASLAIAWQRVVAANIVAIGFTNVGASTNTGAATFDAVAQRR